jgi:hypothetical protein
VRTGQVGYFSVGSLKKYFSVGGLTLAAVSIQLTITNLFGNHSILRKFVSTASEDAGAISLCLKNNYKND